MRALEICGVANLCFSLIPKNSLSTTSCLISLVFALAFLVLAIDPAIWLLRSWSAPGYDSPGALVFALVVAIFVWSATSAVAANVAGPGPDAESGAAAHSMLRLWPCYLLLLSFAVRAASQLLAINVLGAFMLALDVFALALMLRLDQRSRPVSPALLAALFCFALPLEPLLQRTLGFSLQQLSAAGACGLLSFVHPNASCEGVRITIDNVDVLVDLPCSGARLLILLLTAFFFLGSVRALPLRPAVAGFMLTLVLALAGNTLRIVLLAWGLRYHDTLGVDLMQDPWHSTLGLVIAATCIAALMQWLKRVPATPLAVRRSNAVAVPRGKTLSTVLALAVLSPAVLGAALFVVSIRPQPMDVSAPLDAPELPLSLSGLARSPLPLTHQEQRYFSTFGGAAVRAGYGVNSLLVVRTTSPLRHLHAPDVCFSAAGHDIRYVGADFSVGPVAIYRSRSPSGEDLQVRVRFVGDSGLTTHSISEVVWHWLHNPGDIWTMVQTVSPWEADTPDFHAAVRRSFNLFSATPNFSEDSANAK